MTATAIAIGTGSLLSPASHAEQVSTRLLGFGAPLNGCKTCRTMTPSFNYGLGLVMIGNWLLQNPLFGGYSAVEAYLPSKKIAIAVAVTYGEKAFNADGDIIGGNASQSLFAQIGALLAPDDALPAS